MVKWVVGIGSTVALALALAGIWIADDVTTAGALGTSAALTLFYTMMLAAIASDGW